MKRTIYYMLVSLLLCGCEGHFTTWKDLNEDWPESNKANLGSDPYVVEEPYILPSGIQYEVYHRGYGAVPKPTVDPSTGYSSQICVAYSGNLIDGTEFDSSGDSAIWLSLGDCIDGWKEVLGTMPQGSHVKMYIPASMGYGSDGSEDFKGNFVVPPHSTLIFDVELVDVTNY